jgi:hypothetical protein
MKEDPAPDAKCRDKFLVQSVLVSADKEFANVASLVRHTTRMSGTALTYPSAVVTHRADEQVGYPREENKGHLPPH